MDLRHERVKISENLQKYSTKYIVVQTVFQHIKSSHFEVFTEKLVKSKYPWTWDVN